MSLLIKFREIFAEVSCCISKMAFLTPDLQNKIDLAVALLRKLFNLQGWVVVVVENGANPDVRVLPPHWHDQQPKVGLGESLDWFGPGTELWVAEVL